MDQEKYTTSYVKVSPGRDQVARPKVVKLHKKYALGGDALLEFHFDMATGPLYVVNEKELPSPLLPYAVGQQTPH